MTDRARTVLSAFRTAWTWLRWPLAVGLVWWLYRQNRNEFDELSGRSVDWGWLALAFVLCFGSIVSTYIRWWMLVRAQDFDFPLRDALRKDVALAGLDGRFQLLGFESDVPSFLAQLDVFVLSSRQEGFPIALLEALGAGLPVIATRVGGVPEMLGDDGGLVVAPESDEELGAAIGAMASAERRDGYAERGLAMARRFPLERTAREFVALYQRLLETRTSRAFPSDRPTRIPMPKVKVT